MHTHASKKVEIYLGRLVPTNVSAFQCFTVFKTGL